MSGIEKIDLLERNAPGVFLLEALVDSFPNRQLPEEMIGIGGVVEVQLLVNGRPVPVRATLEGMWERASQSLDDEVQKKAQALIEDGGLCSLVEEIQKAQERLRTALWDAEMRIIDAARKLKG